MIKMVVTDLDDTLLRTDKTISNYTMDIIKKVRNQGIKVIFATARGSSTKNLVPYELFDGYVLMNGAKAYTNEKLIYDKTISEELYIPFLQYLSKHRIKAAAQVDGIHYANFNVREKWSYIDHFIITDYTNVSGGADKLYAIVETPSQVDLIRSILPDSLYLLVSRDHLAMVMHKEAKKIYGVLEIARQWNISKNDIVAFGDDTNDKEMLLDCGLSVAMANAIDEIKNLTDTICDTNDDDGVAKWLEENILDISTSTSLYT